MGFWIRLRCQVLLVAGPVNIWRRLWSDSTQGSALYMGFLAYYTICLYIFRFWSKLPIFSSEVPFSLLWHLPAEIRSSFQLADTFFPSFPLLYVDQPYLIQQRTDQELPETRLYAFIYSFNFQLVWKRSKLLHFRDKKKNARHVSCGVIIGPRRRYMY